MSLLMAEKQKIRAKKISITDRSLTVNLEDGRTIIVPLEWYPRLLHGSENERNNWCLTGNGEGIHWPELNEDINVENLLEGNPSGESQHSLQRWLNERFQTKDRPK